MGEGWTDSCVLGVGEKGVSMETFNAVLPELRRLIETDVAALEARFDALGIRWTTGRGAPRD